MLLKVVETKPYSINFSSSLASAAQGGTSIVDDVKQMGELNKRKDPRTNQDLDIDVYTYKHETGICFFYENNTRNKTLSETVTFAMEGLQLRSSAIREEFVPCCDPRVHTAIQVDDV